jgi:hypothetical protein
VGFDTLSTCLAQELHSWEEGLAEYFQVITASAYPSTDVGVLRYVEGRAGGCGRCSGVEM